jgi:hypothetical protein
VSYICFNFWTLCTGTKFGLNRHLLLKELEILRKSLCHIKYDKIGLTHFCFQVQKWQNYLELRVWSHETESVSDSVRGRLRLKCDGTRAETIFCLSAKRTGPFKSAGASVQSTTGRRGVRISGSNAGYTTFRGSVKSTGYPLHSPVSPSFSLPCVTVCHHISTGLYRLHF